MATYLTIRVEDEFKKKVDDAAYAQRRSMSAFVREAIEAAIEKQEQAVPA